MSDIGSHVTTGSASASSEDARNHIDDAGETDAFTFDSSGSRRKNVFYSVNQVPPAGILFSVALQNVLLGLSSALAVAFVICDAICVPHTHPIRAQMFSTTVFMTGICTVIVSLFGVRLPVFQGASLTFLIPLMAMKTDKRWQCEHLFVQNITVLHETIVGNNNTNLSVQSFTSDDKDEEIRHKIREITGALLVASLFEVVVGLTGLVGVFTRFIGPLSVTTVISLIGISLYKVPITYSRAHWGLAMLNIFLAVLFVLYMNRILVPFPTLSTKKQKKGSSGVPVFQMFPILLSVLITWLVCYVITVAGGFSDDPTSLEYRARTDVKRDVITATPWFYIPYPGQYGTPLFNIPIFVGFLSAVISSVFETIGDYYATGFLAEAPPPPLSAINRGILLEGIGSVLSGAVGACHATTSYSSHVALLGMTKVASRSVMVAAGVISILIAIFGKFGALMSTLPDPAIGGAMFVMFGMLCSVGIFGLHAVDMTSSRNRTIFGLSLYAGIVIPEWIERYPEAVDTGSEIADGVVKGILGTPMFLGGIVCILLDNTVKGSHQERGFLSRNVGTDSGAYTDTVTEVYELPGCRRLVESLPWLRKLPFVLKEAHYK